MSLIRVKNNNSMQSLSSGNKSTLNSNKKKYNLDSTYITGSQSRNNTTMTNIKGQSTQFSHNKTKQNIYSKCRSQASFNKSDRKSINTQVTYNQKQSISRLLKEKICQKHQPWFNISDQYPFKCEQKVKFPQQIYGQKKWQKSKQDKFERLIQNMRNKQMKRFEQKILRQNKQIQKTCIFIPNPQKQKECNPQIYDNLYQQHIKIKQKERQNQQIKIMRQNQQIQRNKRRMQDRYKQNKVKWQRYLNTEMNKHYDKRIQQRLEYIIQDKKNLIQELRNKYDPLNRQQGNKQNKKINKQQQKQLIKRLCDDYRIKRKQKQQLIQQMRSKQLNQKCSFSPVINQTDLYRKINNNQDGQHNQNKKQIQKYNKSIEIYKQKYPFKPKIDSMSKIIASKIQSLVYCNIHLNPQQRLVQRLYKGNQQQKQIKLNKISQQIYNQCTFKPQINSISKQLIYIKSNQPQSMLISNYLIPSHKCPLPQSIIQQQKHLTFKPQINQKSKCMSIDQKQQLIMKNKQLSKSKLQKIQYHQQYQQMEQCTFKPKLISTSKEWKVWKQNNLNKNKLITKPNYNHQNTSMNQTDSINQTYSINQSYCINSYSNRQNYHKQNIFNPFNTNDKQNSNKKQQNPQIKQTVKGINTFLKNCQNIKKKKLSHIQRLNQIFNFQHKYDQRIKKQKGIYA